MVKEGGGGGGGGGKPEAKERVPGKEVNGDSRACAKRR